MLNVLSYLVGAGKKDKEHVGHNPASSFAIVTMIVLTFLSILSGFLAQGIEKHHGIFAYMYSDYFKSIELFSGAHSFFANLLIWVVVAHVAGSLIDKYVKKSDAIDSMITGYKQTVQKINIKLNIFQKVFAIVWILVSLYSVYFLVFTKNIFIL
jgi:cytochrome b